MLIKFKTDAYADIIMFGDVARQLLKMMGHSGTIPGAILAPDVSNALDRLKRAIESAKSAEQPPNQERGDENEQASVRLSYRALPLIELLTAAAKKKRDVMWEKM